MFRSFNEILDAARARGPVSSAGAAAHDPDVIEALKFARELGLAEGILVGKGSEILAPRPRQRLRSRRQPNRKRARTRRLPYAKPSHWCGKAACRAAHEGQGRHRQPYDPRRSSIRGYRTSVPAAS